MHETLEQLGSAPLYKRLLALVFFLALLVGFRHLALLFVTFIVLARGLGYLGARRFQQLERTVHVLLAEFQGDVDGKLRTLHGRLAAIEVKSQVGHVAGTHRGLAEFAKRHLDARCHLVGSDELPVAEFLMRPAAEWTR